METKTKKDLVKNFNKLFFAKDEQIKNDNKIKTEDLKGYMDKTNCIMLIPLDYQIKENLLINFDEVWNIITSSERSQKSTKC